MSVDNLPENDTTLSPAMRLWHALDRRRQLDESGKYCVGAAYDPEVRIIEGHLTELEQLRAERAEMLWVLREAMLFVLPDVGNGNEVLRRFEPFRAIHEAAALRLLGRENENPADP